MSPENQQPNSPQGIKDLINTSTHPEGVREFKSGDLPDVADDLTRHNDVSAIDPETRDVTFDKIELKPENDTSETEVADSPDQNSEVDALTPEAQLATPPTIEVPHPTETIPTTREKIPAWKKWVAALAGTAAVGSLGYGASKALGNDHNATPVPTTPTASAPAVPGATETGSAVGENEGAGLENQPEALIGIANTTFEKANVHVPKELAEQAAQPILATEHAPMEAAQLLLQDLNIYLLSGDLDENGAQITPESASLGQRIEENLFGNSEIQQANNTDLSKLRELRLSLANSFMYMNSANIKDGDNAATYHREYVLGDYIQQDESTYTFAVTATTYSNFHEKDPDWVVRTEPIAEELTLKNVDGRYISQTLREIN